MDIKQFSESKFDLGLTVMGIIVVTFVGVSLLLWFFYPHFSIID
jgi:hypothetical protein